MHDGIAAVARDPDDITQRGFAFASLQYLHNQIMESMLKIVLLRSNMEAS